jgi:hypothetical protein
VCLGHAVACGALRLCEVHGGGGECTGTGAGVDPMDTSNGFDAVDSELHALLQSMSTGGQGACAPDSIPHRRLWADGMDSDEEFQAFLNDHAILIGGDPEEHGVEMEGGAHMGADGMDSDEEFQAFLNDHAILIGDDPEEHGVEMEGGANMGGGAEMEGSRDALEGGAAMEGGGAGMKGDSEMEGGAEMEGDSEMEGGAVMEEGEESEVPVQGVGAAPEVAWVEDTDEEGDCLAKADRLVKSLLEQMRVDLPEFVAALVRVGGLGGWWWEVRSHLLSRPKRAWGSWVVEQLVAHEHMNQEELLQSAQCQEFGPMMVGSLACLPDWYIEHLYSNPANHDLVNAGS